jgi:hypothetical protein
MKVETKKLKELLELSDVNFGPQHVTLSYDTKEWLLTANYTKLGDSFTDFGLYKEEDKVTLDDKQLDLICGFLKKAMDDELQSEYEHRKRSMGDEYEQLFI